MKPGRGIIIVSGSNGRSGDAVMRRFAGRFEDVVGFDRKAPQPAPPGCVYVSVAITSDESVQDRLRTIRDHHGAHVASVVHLAAYYDLFGRPSPQYEEITVHGTGCLLRGLRELGFRLEQFVFSSTMLFHRPGDSCRSPVLRHQALRPRARALQSRHWTCPGCLKSIPSICPSAR